MKDVAAIVNKVKATGLFDEEWYCKEYPDIKAVGMDPVEHFVRYGIPLRRKANKNPEVSSNIRNLVLQKGGKNIVEIVTDKPAAQKLPDFLDFADFLSCSLVSPVVSGPFREEHKRCFASMESIARHFERVSGPVQDRIKVSILMSVYNREETVEKAINSVLNQKYKNIQLIVVDDGSGDGTWPILAGIKDPRVRVIKNETNIGKSASLNKAIELIEGEYVAYLDSDNTWDQRYLSAMMGVFVERPDFDALYSGQLLYSGDHHEPFAIRFGAYNKALLANRNYIDHNSFMHKFSVFQKAGVYDPELRRCLDYDFILRAAKICKMASVPFLLSNYHYGKAENAITDNGRYLNDAKRVYAKSAEYMSFQLNTPSSRRDILERPVSVVIPNYESLDDIRQCLQSLYGLQETGLVEIIVVDNNSSPEVVDFLKAENSERKIKLIANDVNYGFTYAVNQGISEAGKDRDILLLNNDAMVQAGAIRIMQQKAYSLQNAGLIVPRQILPGGTDTIKVHVPYADPDRDCDVNLSVHHRNVINVPLLHDGEDLELSFAPFFCVYIKHSVLSGSVGMDAEYGRHYRSDRVFCNYVRHVMGLKIYYVSGAIVYHKLQKSTNYLRARSEDFDIMFRKNQWDESLRNKLGFRRASWDI